MFACELVVREHLRLLALCILITIGTRICASGLCRGNILNSYRFQYQLKLFQCIYSHTLERNILCENWIQLCIISVEYMPLIQRVYKFRHPEGNLNKMVLQSSCFFYTYSFCLAASTTHSLRNEKTKCTRHAGAGVGA